MQSGRERLEPDKQTRIQDESNRTRRCENEDAQERDHGIKAEANGMPDRDGSHV